VDHDKKSSPHSLKHENSVDQFLNRLKNDLHPAQAGDDSVAAAVEAVQRFALEIDSEAGPQMTSPNTCRGCGSSNRAGNRFCSNCGVPLMASAVEQKGTVPDQSPPPGEHHYHHHYHHHYFSADGGSQPTPVASVPTSTHDSRMRPPVSGASLTRAETAVRKLTHDWALACNGKHLDDLVSLYLPDGLILRSNIPPVRGTSAIREFFFSVLDAGLGDVELEPLRLEVFGEIAYEAGRFSMLVPVAMGKRREERGKYMILAARQAGDWNIVADCWSSDLNLVPASEIGPSSSSPTTQAGRSQRKP
jgi:ketosteroid isomerase-like protein